MWAGQPKTYFKERHSQGQDSNFQNRGDFAAFASSSSPGNSKNGLFRRLANWVYWIASGIRFVLFRIMAPLGGNRWSTWLKVSIAGLALYVMVKKEVQFTVNMQAPDFSRAEQLALKLDGADEMGVAGSLAVKQAPSKASSPKTSDDLVREYIQRFSKVALAEQEKFGIPASVKIAQGIIESQAGTDPAASKENNHFGAPLSRKKYQSSWENWRSHSLLLSERYPQLFEHGLNYRAWAEGLEWAGYADDQDYAEKIIQVIERFQLYQLDQA